MKKPKQQIVALLEQVEESKEQVVSFENQLKVSKDKFNKLFLNLADEVHMWKLVKDEKGNIKTWELTDVNPVALKAWKKTKEQVVGKTANDIFGYDATNQFLSTIQKIFDTGKPFSWVEYFEPTDQYLSMTSIPMGEHFISTGEDITERIKSEKKLKISEEKYRNIAENFPGIIFRYKLCPQGGGEFLYISNGVRDLYEISQDEAIRNNSLLLDRIHKDDLDSFTRSIKESSENLTKWKIEHRIQFPDGRIKWVSLKGVPVPQDDGSVIWDAFGYDITELKNSKEQLKLLNTNLEQIVQERTEEILTVSKELELYRLAAEHAQSGVWYYNLRTNQLTWDDIMYKLYGVDKDNFSGAYEAWERSLHPADRASAVGALNKSIENKKPFDTVFRIIHPGTGEVSHLRAKGKVEFDSDGEAKAVFGTNWDITKEMKLSIEKEEALTNLKEAQSQMVLSEKMASLGVLTAGIAHEINNPLNYIMGGYWAILEHLDENDLLQEEVSEYLSWIKTGVDRASDIVKSLNLFSRQGEEKNEKCDLHAIIINCISILQHKHKNEIQIVKELLAEDPVILGNSGKLHQVILNILSNSIDSIEDQGRILIQTFSDDKQLEIIIRDNGAGISKDHLRNITDPFFTTKAPGEGTGLGLSISKSILNEHNGKLNFDSEVDKGTVCSIVIPK